MAGRLAAVLLSLTIATLAVRARAEPSAAQKEQARQLMKSGDAHMDAGSYDEALASYQAADDIMAVPMTRLWVCKAQERRNKLLEARERCLSVQNLPVREDPEPEPFVAARAEAAEIARALQPRIPTLLVRVVNALPGETLEIRVDGELVPASLHASPRPANPGEHAVAVAAGARRAEAKVTLVEAEQRTLDVILAGGPSPTPTLAPKRSGGGVSPLVWVGFGAGAAGLIVGAVAGGIAAARASDLDERCPEDRCDARDPAIVDDYDAAFVSAHVATAGFVLAGVGIAVGVVGLFLPPGQPQEASVEPWLGPTGAGIRGRF